MLHTFLLMNCTNSDDSFYNIIKLAVIIWNVHKSVCL